MSITIVGGGNPSGPTFPVQRSVRLRGSASAYFNRTPAVVPTNYTKTTISFWAKNIFKTDGDYSTIYAQGDYDLGIPSNRNGSGIYFVAGQLWINEYAAGTTRLLRQSNALFRDPSSWYHFVISIDTTLPQGNNQCVVWCNGVQLTWASTTNPTQNTNLYFQSTLNSYIGTTSFTNPASKLRFLDGYLTEFNFIDGQALTPASFGTYNNYGVWSPAKYTGTYGTNGFYLNFQDNSAATAAAIGKDSSGNGNNWTPNNISVTAGVTYDSMLDVPTLTSANNANYPTLSPIDTGGGSVTLSGGNLNYSIASSTGSQVRGTMGTDLTSKWYFEFTAGSAASPTNPQIFGLSTTEGQITNNSTSLRKAVSAYSDGSTNRNIFYYLNGTLTSNYQIALTSVAIGDILQIAYDAATGKVWFGKNNSWLDASNGTTGNPSAGTNQTVTIATGDAMTPYLANLGATYSGSLNCGQRPFTYTPPTGFKRLNTYNLPAPTIPNGATQFAATTYTGTGATQSITNTVNGTSLQPDFVWIKSRNNIGSHHLIDSVRGIPLFMFSDATSGDTSRPNSFTSFNSNGFTVGSSSDGNTNLSTYTYVGWQWKANGTPAVTNTSGSIPSTISANTTAGFSIVTYTGTGANATVGHGLGVAPKMVIVKQRNSANSWIVYQSSLGATKYLRLETTDASATATAVWNDTAPTSSVFTVGTSGTTNGSTATYVAYCWAEIPGFSKFGSFTGNGSTDGPFVYLGFIPRFVLYKSTTEVTGWAIIDTSRSPSNVADKYLNPNTTAAEGTASLIDITSNGFKVRNTNAGNNTNGATYIYACFAENPFNYSLARQEKYMFAIVQNGIIMMLVQPGVAFEWDGNFYPANWCNVSTPEEKASIGMVDVVYGAQANDQYYWVSEDAPVYNSETNQVDINFTNTPKNLDGVKTSSIQQVNSTAYSILLPTDWMVVKAVETSTTVPTDWNTWRESIRTTAATATTSINSATDVDAVATVMQNIVWPLDPDQVAAELAQGV